MTKPLCMAPLTSIALWANGSSTMCCEDKNPSLGNWHDKTPLELINTPELCERRLKTLNRELLDGCVECLKTHEHAANIYDFYDEVYKWENIKDDINTETGEVTKVRYLLVGLSNICNLACRMCFPTFSNTLSNDRHKIFNTPRVPIQRNDLTSLKNFIKQMGNDLEIITFHGGLSIIDPDFISILETIPSSTEVQIISNGTTFDCKGVDIRPYLKRFKHIHYTVSVDGSREVSPYIRVHSNYDTVIEHCNAIKELPNVHLNIHSCLMNTNIFDIPKMYNEFINGELSVCDSLSAYIVTEPDIYSVQNLPTELRKQANALLRDYIISLGDSDKEKQVFESLVNCSRMMNKTELNRNKWNEFLLTTKKTDNYYKFETPEVFKSYVDQILI